MLSTEGFPYNQGCQLPHLWTGITCFDRFTALAISPQTFNEVFMNHFLQTPFHELTMQGSYICRVEQSQTDRWEAKQAEKKLTLLAKHLPYIFHNKL